MKIEINVDGVLTFQFIKRRAQSWIEGLRKQDISLQLQLL